MYTPKDVLAQEVAANGKVITTCTANESDTAAIIYVDGALVDYAQIETWINTHQDYLRYNQRAY